MKPVRATCIKTSFQWQQCIKECTLVQLKNNSDVIVPYDSAQNPINSNNVCINWSMGYR